VAKHPLFALVIGFIVVLSFVVQDSRTTPSQKGAAAPIPARRDASSPRPPVVSNTNDLHSAYPCDPKQRVSSIDHKPCNQSTRKSRSAANHKQKPTDNEENLQPFRMLKADMATDLTSESTGGYRTGHVEIGDAVFLIDENPFGCVKVKTQNGQSGWASASYFESKP
jgi:hypothetical protein